jgi:uncharacterized protein
MTPQERDLITTLLTRLKGTAGQPQDPEADAVIRQAMAEQPDAPYYLVQTVLIQDLSLHQARDRIAELERQLSDANAQRSSGTSFLGNLFGHRDAPPPAPAPTAGPWSRGPQVAPPPAGPGYAQPGYSQPGYAQPGYGGMTGGMGGSGFLRSAAATAAGIAGGALLFEGISSLFGHGYANSLYGGGGYNPGLGETVINNYYGDSGSGGDYGGGGDPGSVGGGADTGGDYGGGGDFSGGDPGDGGGDFGGGGDLGGGDDGGDFGGGGDPSC